MKELLAATSSADLVHKLESLDLTVSRRTEGRTTEQTERFTIAHLLSSLPSDQLAFPLSVQHGDRPDFSIVLPAETIGVEVTEAVAENLARAAAMRERGAGPSVHMLSRATAGEPTRTNASLRDEIIRDTGGTPWVGDEPEREWTAAMLHFAAVKVAKAARPGFTKCHRNWLLIYDNWSVPAIDLEKAAGFLHPELLGSQIFLTFDRVFALGSRAVCEFGATFVRVHPVSLRT